MSTHSVQKLRSAVLAKPDLIEKKLDDLSTEFSLTMVPSSYTIDYSQKLELPEGFSQKENKDTANCLVIHKMLPLLTPAEATDERLWVTLCFGLLSEYVNSRWPLRRSVEDKLSSHVLNHWFGNSVRGRMRDNGVSRLWWMGYISNRVPNMPLETVHEILFANSDYRSNLLERTSSANSLSVLIAILRVSQAAFAEGIPYQRYPYREFMRRVNFLGGRRNLAAMDEVSLINLFAPEYKKCYVEVKKDNNLNVET